MNETEEEIVLAAGKLYFTWADYAMFCAMLMISTAIGIYFGCFGSRQKSAAEYLLGGRQMGIWPIAMSLVASDISGITILGVPSEIYVYGTQYVMICLSAIVVCIGVNTIYLPVFHKLQLTSIFEYLELRFSRSVRIAASLLYTLSQALYVPIVVYLPALAFSQVSGVNLHLVTPIVSSICIFYTMLGGIKAVVWTDFIQQIIMLLASIAVIVLGLIRIGGLSNMWHISSQGGRTDFFNMDPSIFARMTFITITCGWTFKFLGNCGVSQSMVQRFLAVPTLSDARKTMILFTIGMIICKFLSCMTGLLLYAEYHDCDPLTTKVIAHQDQLLPYYVMQISEKLRGLPGLFVAGVFSAALSTMSTCLNSIAGTLFEDFVAPCLSRKMKEKHSSLFLKGNVVIVGSFCVVMVLLVEKLGGAVQMSISLGGVTLGAILGVFTLGILCPWANTIGALVGSAMSLIIVGTLVLGSQIAIASKKLVYTKLPVSTEGCPHLYNSSAQNINHHLTPITEPSEPPFILFRISFMYFSVIGCLTVMIVGTLVSLCTGPECSENIDRDLLCPVIYRWLPATKKSSRREITVEEPLLIFNNFRK